MKSLSTCCLGGIAALLLLGVGILFWSCSNPGDLGQYNPNQPPITRLSNVPPPQDTIKTPNPRLTLSWVGDDPDGYVVGFRYRWSFRLTSHDAFQYKKYMVILNIVVKGFALMVDTDVDTLVPGVYKYFATLPPEGLDAPKTDSLAVGDTIKINGIGVFASNPDSIRIQSTGLRVKYSFPVHVNPNSGTFIFDSQDTLNFHTFEVSAIDNLGAVSTNAAMVSFWTPQVTPPHTEIVAYPTDTVYVLNHKTDTFRGIRFAYRGFDPNSRTIDYSWVVDRDLWPAGQVPWTEFDPSEEAFITASDFPDPYAMNHTFYVRARNEFGSVDTIFYFYRTARSTAGDSTGIDTVRAWRDFRVIYPAFQDPHIPYQQKILFIDNNFEDAKKPFTIDHPSRQMVTDYYTSLLNDLGKPTSMISYWKAGPIPPDGAGFPSLTELQKYSLVIFVADGVDGLGTLGGTKPGLILSGGRQSNLISYCYVGGKLITSGWDFRSTTNCQQSPEWFSNVWHIELQIRGAIYDTAFIGATGQLGYPTIQLDTAKLDTGWGGSLFTTWLAYPVGFGEIISQAQFNGRLRPQNNFYNNGPVAVRYLGITFDSIYLGYPLYYVERSTALAVLRKIFQDIHED
jgi:hypothetical protein